MMLVCLLIILSISTSHVFAQQLSGEINLLEGVAQENGLPEGWMPSVDNDECMIKFQNGGIYFERSIPGEKCSFSFRKNLDNGDYSLKTTFEIDGNEPGIFLDGNPLEKQNEVKVTDGVLHVGIQTKGSGKVWGNISGMALSKASRSNLALSAEVIRKIKEIASSSRVSEYAWKDRGKAPVGYIKGIAVTYAKSYYELITKKKTAVNVMSQKLGGSQVDALAHYSISATSDADRLRAVYTLALGLGLRESSGNTTEGRDTTVKNPTEANAEAGLFQISYDSFNYSHWIGTLFDQYSSNRDQCSYSIFMEGAKDLKRKVVGSGEGANFQAFTKECPSFATEYVMILLRLNRSHFGPINSKKAEYNLDAEKMFRDIEKLIDAMQ